jgi:carboxyl-terminal processing protease
MQKDIKSNVIISAVLVGGVLFFGGFFFGTRYTSEQAKVSTVINKDAVASTTADFAPFWKAWNILGEKFVQTHNKATTTDQQKVWGAIQGLAASFGDPYTVFFPPAESKSFSEQISGNFDGVGMEVGMQDDVLTVIAPLKGNPAERAGVKAGDKIIEIDGKTTQGLNVDEAVKNLRGVKGSTVTITVIRKDATEPLTFKLVRDTIVIPDIDTEKLANGIFLIRLYSFDANAASEFRQALREFVSTGDKKLILDLRNNPGGYLEAAVDMASWFLPTGDVVVSEDYGNGQANNVYRSVGYNIFNNNLKFLILINGGSASASEILSGALQEHGVAKLIGEKSFGKGSVQELVPITSDTTLKVTIARWLTPNGRSISDGGLTPDISVPFVPDPKDVTKDNQLEAAIKELSK